MRPNTVHDSRRQRARTAANSRPHRRPLQVTKNPWVASPELTSACATKDSAMALAAGPAKSGVVANRVFFRLYQASN
jgi:hypothetical protein